MTEFNQEDAKMILTPLSEEPRKQELARYERLVRHMSKIDKLDYYDNYIERICILMAEGHWSERWAKREAYKEVITSLRHEAGYKAGEASGIMTEFRHRAVADGVTGEF